MATPHAESAAGQRSADEEAYGRGAEVLDLAAVEAGRTRTAAALDRLVRAGAEAQAELALLRAQQVRDPEPRREDAAVEVNPVAEEAQRLRIVSGALQHEQEATRALAEAVRTELSVLYQAKSAAEFERDAAMAEVDS
ncbi:MAG TPA: hypothetical protein VN180_05840, partial [Acidimicrobiia bacterium]|nr:hypothetical protein [Acidimicrobiia bacterium]